MNFQLAAIGHSFKGSMAYYLHDKRQDEASPHPDTSERVAWTEQRNMAAAHGPHTATRMMIATAQSADELKAAAGVKATGRKSTRGPVFAFSLAWHPSEADGLDRAEMTRAADHALKVLALDHLQAVIIAHEDTAHPHVHVVVNRIDPTNGKATSIDGVKVKKLDKWAHDYEQQRGQIVSPNRAEKYDRIKAAQDANPDPEKRRAHIEDKKRQTRRRVDLPSADPQRRKIPAKAEQRPPSRGQMLKELADAQKAQHRKDWKDWGAKAKADRKAIYANADAQRAAALAAFKASTRSDWAQHFRAERDRARAFEARERSVSGVVQNALAAARRQFREQPQGGRGMLALTFANVLSSDARRQAFSQAQEMTARQFREQMKSRRDAELARIDARKRSDLIRQSAVIDKAKAELIERHNLEREKTREAWRQFYASKDSAAPGQTYRTRKPQPLPVKDHQPMKDQFDKARLAEAKPTPAAIPNDDLRLTTPAPAPRPAGIVDPPHSDVKPVPAVDKSAAIATDRKPSARRDWTAEAEARQAPKPQEPKATRRDWTAEAEARAAQKPQEPTKAPARIDWAARAAELRKVHGDAAKPDQPKQRPDGPRMKP